MYMTCTSYTSGMVQKKNSQHSPKTAQCGVYQFLRLSHDPKEESKKVGCYGLVILNTISRALLTASGLPVSQDNLTVGWIQARPAGLPRSVQRLVLFLFHVNAHWLFYLGHSRLVTQMYPHTFILSTYCIYERACAFSFLSHSLAEI